MRVSLDPVEKLSPVEAAMLRAASLTKTPDKKSKTPVYNLTLQQIEDIKRQAVDESVATALVLMLGLPAMVLTDKRGFTSEDIDEVVDDVLDLYDSFQRGYLTLDDIHNTLREEHGLSIREKKKRRKYK